MEFDGVFIGTNKRVKADIPIERTEESFSESDRKGALALKSKESGSFL
jgi:hypothetical protein